MMKIPIGNCRTRSALLGGFRRGFLVEQAIDQAVGEHVLLSRHVSDLDFAERAQKLCCSAMERLQAFVFDAIFAAQLLDDELGIEANG